MSASGSGGSTSVPRGGGGVYHPTDTHTPCVGNKQGSQVLKVGGPLGLVTGKIGWPRSTGL